MNIFVQNKKKPLILWQVHESNISGANRSMLDYLELMANEYSFHIVIPHEGHLSEKLFSLNIPFTIIKQYGWASSEKRNIFFYISVLLRNSIAFRKTCILINSLVPSLYFTNTIIPYIGAKAAYKSKIKHVWWIHEFGEEDFNFKIGFGNLQWAYNKMSKWSNLIICNSNAVKNKFENLILNVPFHTNYQLVKWPSSYIKPIVRKPYLMFGQINESKGHLEVIKALGEVKNKKLKLYPIDIIGPCHDLNYYSLLMDTINALGLNDYVSIKVGYFENFDIIPNYKALILASKCEAFGRVIIEACKSGLKVIAKSTGSIPELINQTNGLVYRDIDELVKILSTEQQVTYLDNRLNYSEEEEFENLQKLLSQLIK